MAGYGVSPLETLAKEAMLQGLAFLDAYTYSAVFSGTTVLPASQSQTVGISMDAGVDFMVQQINVTAYTAGPTLLANPNYLIQITRTGSRNQVMNQPQHVQNVCGNYWNNNTPGYWPMPSLWLSKTNIQVQLTNLSATAALRVDVAFTGFNVYYLKGSAEQLRQSIFHIL